MKKLLILGPLSLFVVACANSPTAAPTHRWASTEDADRAKYHQDHARCQASANVAAQGIEIDTKTASFTAYKQCMNNSGYELTAYNNR